MEENQENLNEISELNSSLLNLYSPWLKIYDNIIVPQ